MLWFSPKDKIAKERFVAARAQSDCAQHHMGVWQSVQARLNLYVPFSFSTKRILRNNCWVWLFSVLPADPVPQESVYGRREGCITGLAVFHRDRANIFRTSAGIKSAVIHDVKMLPRHAMWKPTALWLKRLNAPSGLPNMFVVYQPFFGFLNVEWITPVTCAFRLHRPSRTCHILGSKKVGTCIIELGSQYLLS